MSGLNLNTSGTTYFIPRTAIDGYPLPPPPAQRPAPTVDYDEWRHRRAYAAIGEWQVSGATMDALHNAILSAMDDARDLTLEEVEE